jgi:hypothetical protein
MGVTKGADFDEFIEDDFEGEDFAYIEDAAERRRPQKARKSNKASWRSVEDYMENRRLKNQLTDVFDED